MVKQEGAKLCEMFVCLSYSQQTCHTAGMWAEGWAALWNKLYTESWRSGCPAGTHLCSGLVSRRSQTRPWTYINTTHRPHGAHSAFTDIGSKELHKHTREPTWVSVCWTTLLTTGRFHPRFRASPQTHCSCAGPEELRGAVAVSDSWMSNNTGTTCKMFSSVC